MEMSEVWSLLLLGNVGVPGEAVELNISDIDELKIAASDPDAPRKFVPGSLVVICVNEASETD